LFLSECLLLFIKLSTQSGNFWIHPRMFEDVCQKKYVMANFLATIMLKQIRIELQHGWWYCLGIFHCITDR